MWEEILFNYGPIGLLCVFIVHVLSRFEKFMLDVEARCESRYATLFKAYEDLAKQKDKF